MTVPHESAATERPIMRDLAEGVPFCTVVFLVARLALSAIGVLAVQDAPPLEAAGFPNADILRPVTSGWHNAFEGTYRWDAAWFLRITDHGYDEDDGSAEFYPGFPLASRFVAAALPIGSLGAAILVANLSFFVGLVFLFALTKREFDTDIARRATLLLAAYPASLIFMAPYSEGLFLAGSCAAFYFIRRDRWVSGAVAGIVTTATRAVGVLLVPAFIVEAMTTEEPAKRRRRLIAAMTPLLGVITYLVYWQIRAGDPMIPLEAPALWDRTTQFPLTTIGRAIGLGVTGVFRDGLPWTADLVLTLAVAIPLVIGWRLLRLSYVIYAATTFLVILTVAYAPRPLVGGPRYAALLFPAFWILALKLRGKAYVAMASAFAIAYVVVAAIFVQQRTFMF